MRKSFINILLAEMKDNNKTYINENYFPFNFAWVGNLFPHNELIVVYEKKN